MELEMTPKQISSAAEDQVEFAILAAKVVYLCDIRSESPPSLKSFRKNCAVMESQSFLSLIRWIARRMKFYLRIFSLRARGCF